MKKEEFVKDISASRFEENLKKIPLRGDFLLRHVGSGKDVLDAGACTGYFAAMIKDAGNRVKALDLNPDSIKIAREKGIDVIEFDLEEDLPFPPDSFDVVVAYEIMEHLFDTKHFLEECKRVLRPEGFILISTPNLNSLYHRILITLGCRLHFLGTYPGDLHGDHIRIFNRKTLANLLRMTGFADVEWQGVSYLPYPLHLAFKFLPTFGDLLLVKAIKSNKSK